MYFRNKPKAARERDRSFWSWTKLGYSREEKDHIIFEIVESLYRDNLLERDLRTIAAQNRVHRHLIKVIQARGFLPTSFKDLHARRPKELRTRLLRVVTAYKWTYLRQRAQRFSRIELLPTEMISAIGKFLQFGALYHFGAASKRLWVALKFDRRKRLGENPLASRADYGRYLFRNVPGGPLNYLREAENVDQPMLWAVQNGWTGALRAFLQRSTNPNCISLFGNCMLYVALSCGQPECAQILIRAGALLDVSDPGDGMSPLLAAICGQSDAIFDILREEPPLLSKGEWDALWEHMHEVPKTQEWLIESGVCIDDLADLEAQYEFNPLPIIFCFD
ncbi:hypothetical protein P170DRAFT_427520 [Aspergillus steynii IBT 23096]|uniref:Uncharacterized protein n=1 Tax=Aspergillus steynii IBT 23096 TaxID=1392250 RepID=A0A2I2G6C4_9EURO|nr:uncharacterized protein P170DRAFT_427520 [Aspergillus steynii IBT 23096]PLB48436.1 hypothetical protein P170DRAFT_427520 [Aspergillus steynii IBT 23096]